MGVKQQWKVAVIGLGRFAQLHLQCLRQLEGEVIVQAVCDTDPSKVEQAVDQWGCRGYDTWESMLLHESSLDAVHVVTPEMLHFGPVCAALEAGCHVLVEKPLAVSVEEARRMQLTAQQCGKQLVTAHVCRFDPRYAELKQLVDSGRLGPLRSIYARRNDSAEYFPIYRRTHPTYILGIHDIDLMLWLHRAEVVEVYAMEGVNAQHECDMVWAMLKFADGMTGVLEHQWLVPASAPVMMNTQMDVVGQNGTVQLRDPGHSFNYWGEGTVLTPSYASGYTAHGRIVGALFEEIHHFYTCLADGRASHILHAADALRAVEISEAIVRSGQTGRPVRL